MLVYSTAPLITTNTPTLQNSFAGQFSEPIFFTRIGNAVHINGFITRASNPTGGTIICTVPVGFRPLNLIRCFFIDSAQTVAGRADLATNGNLSYVWGNVTSYAMFSTTYLVS